MKNVWTVLKWNVDAQSMDSTSCLVIWIKIYSIINAKHKNFSPVNKKNMAIGIRNNPIPKNGSASAKEIKKDLLMGFSNFNNASPILSKKNVMIKS